MIYVNSETCNGCGACLEICPENAIVIQNAVAYIDEKLCKGCEHCVDSCPLGAILCVDLITNETMVSQPEKESQIIPITGAPDQSPHRPELLFRALPVLGSTLIWAGREILPHLAPLALDLLEKRRQNRYPAMFNSVDQMLSQEIEARPQLEGRQRRRRQLRGGRRSRNGHYSRTTMKGGELDAR